MFHFFHKYEIIKWKLTYSDVYNYFYDGSKELKGKNIPTTIFLQKCKKCGNIKIEKVEGHWGKLKWTDLRTVNLQDTLSSATKIN